jgi:very-short-patch-repair endonuclease
MAKQHGLVTLAQAQAAGITQRQVERRLARGAWERVHRGVFRHVAHPDTWESRLLAAVLAVGTGAVVSHRAAVGLLGLRGFRALVIEVSRPTVTRAARPGVVIHRSPDLQPHHVCTRQGVPVTRPARTLVDLGAVARPHFVARCMEEWLADGLVSIEDVHGTVAEHAGRGRRGVGVLRAVLGDRVLVDAADSRVEERLARVLADHGVSLPEHHHVVRLDRGIVAELDYAYPDKRVALEVDGYGVHLRSRETFEYDRDRQNELEIAGWRVLRFTSRALAGEPERVASQVARMLTLRARSDTAPT